MRKIFCLLLLILAIILLVDCCFDIQIAEAAADGVLDDLTTQIKTTLKNSSLSEKLLSLANSLFFTLALIQLAWNFMQLAADGKTDMQSLVSMLIRQIIFIGFFYYFLQNGVTIFTSIIDGFQAKGIELSGVNSVTEIFHLGVDTANTLIKTAWKATPWRSIIPVMAVISIASIIVLMAFTTATLCAVITLCKTYIACTVGVYFLGFGGNSYTKDIAINAVKVCYMSGVEYFVIFLLVGIGKDVFKNLITLEAMKGGNVYHVAFQVLVAAVVYGGCVKTIPGFIAGIVTGASGSAGAGVAAEVSGAMAAAGAAAGAAVGTVMTGGAMLAGGAEGAMGAGGGIGAKAKAFATGAAGAKQGSIGGHFREAGMNQLKGNTSGGNSPAQGTNPNNVTPGDAG